MSFIEELKYRLKQYKRKYYYNILLKGGIFFIAVFISLFLGFNLLEHLGRFDSITRAVMFFAFIALNIYALYYWVLVPVYHLIKIEDKLSDEKAAQQLGQYFPEVKDKLLNILQLNRNGKSNELILASIEQKYTEIGSVKFTSAVDINENRKFLSRYLVAPLLLLLLLFFLDSNILTKSTTRIISYDKQFVETPFTLTVSNKNLHCLYNNAFILDVELAGKALPQEIFLLRQNRSVKMDKIDESHFQFTFPKVYKDEVFQLKAAGFVSESYRIKVVSKPKIAGLNIALEYPKYTKRKNETLQNNGDLRIPEGTKVSWSINTEATDNFSIRFGQQNIEPKLGENNAFAFDSTFTSNTTYDLVLKNKYADENASYNIQVIKDQYPNIRVTQIQDTTYYESIYINGVINDDYGFSSLRLYYKKSDDKKYSKISIPISYRNLKQTFNLKIPLDSIGLKPGESLSYFVDVWDNDQVNRPKKTRSTKFSLHVPSESDLDDKIDAKDQEIAKEIDSTTDKVKKHQDKLSKLHDKLKSKKELNWEDKQELKKLLKEHEDIKKDINKVNKDLAENQFKKDKFQEQDEALQKKADELQKLMEEVMNPELQKLYEELEKLLQNQTDMRQLDKTMEELERKNESLEKQLDRNIEMMKQLKFEQDLQQQINKLNELAERQEKLAEETLNKEANQEELKQEQEKIQEEFDRVKDKMDQMEKENKEMENPNSFDPQEQEQESIDQKMDQAQEQLGKKQNKKASQQQKQAGQQMKELSDNLAQQQQAQQMQQQEENLEHLRLLLENLVRLSFEQERLMVEFRGISQKDPRYVPLSKRQIDLQDDAKIVEDSLYSLAKRVPEIQSFVTEEVESMNKYMDESVKIIKERQARRAAASQQYAMTSMNNLALMLSDVMQQMQEQMAEQKKGNQMCQKPGQKPGNKPSLGDLQKQLNQQIQELKNGQKSGQQLSEKLAELAAQQERLRRSLQELKENGEDGSKAGQELSNELKRLEQLMKETEKDLVNKNVNQRTIQRQEQIMTRLLKAEKASKEREYEEKRKGTTAKEIEKPVPPAIEEYLKAKRKELELLKEVPPNLQPYYKEKVNQYFNSQR